MLLRQVYRWCYGNLRFVFDAMSKHDKHMLGVVEVFTFYFTFAAQVVVITNAVKK